MTWFPDLSQYTYMQDSYLRELTPEGQDTQVKLNVGWLDSGHDFPVGEPPAGFLDDLAQLCATNAHARTRGWHRCNLPHEQQLEYPFTIKVDGNQIPLGSAEIRVSSADGTMLTAPNLVWHYVDYHRYLPPPEFVEAVLARREVK